MLWFDIKNNQRPIGCTNCFNCQKICNPGDFSKICILKHIEIDPENAQVKELFKLIASFNYQMGTDYSLEKFNRKWQRSFFICQDCNNHQEVKNPPPNLYSYIHDLFEPVTDIIFKLRFKIRNSKTQINRLIESPSFINLLNKNSTFEELCSELDDYDHQIETKLVDLDNKREILNFIKNPDNRRKLFIFLDELEHNQTRISQSLDYIEKRRKELKDVQSDIETQKEELEYELTEYNTTSEIQSQFLDNLNQNLLDLVKSFNKEDNLNQELQSVNKQRKLENERLQMQRADLESQNRNNLDFQKYFGLFNYLLGDDEIKNVLDTLGSWSKIKKTVKNLNEQIPDLKQAKVNLISKFSQIGNEIQDTLEENKLDQSLCPVCLTSVFDRALECGHVVCHECLDYLSNGCPKCRSTISLVNVRKLYI